MPDAVHTTITGDGTVLEVVLDRPKANAIDAATSREMSRAFAEFRDDPSLRVAILTGGGDRFFSAGWISTPPPTERRSKPTTARVASGDLWSCRTGPSQSSVPSTAWQSVEASRSLWQPSSWWRWSMLGSGCPRQGSASSPMQVRFAFPANSHP